MIAPRPPPSAVQYENEGGTPMMQAKFSVRISAQRRMGAVLAGVIVFSSLCAPAPAHAQRGATPTPRPTAVDAAARCISDTGPLIPATPGKVNYRTAPRANGALVNAPFAGELVVRATGVVTGGQWIGVETQDGATSAFQNIGALGASGENAVAALHGETMERVFLPDGKTSIPCVPETLIPAEFGPVAYTYDERGQVYAQVEQLKTNPNEPLFAVLQWDGKAWQGAPTGGAVDSATSADVSGQAVEMVRSEELPEWFGGFGLDLTGYPDVQGHLNPKYAGAFFDKLVTAIAYQQSTLNMVEGRPEISPAELLKMLEETNGVMEIVIPVPDPASGANFQDTIPVTATVDLSKGVVFGFAPYEDPRLFRIGQLNNPRDEKGNPKDGYVKLGVDVSPDGQLVLLMNDYSMRVLPESEERSKDAIAQGKKTGSVEASLGASRMGFYTLLLQLLAAALQGGHSPEAGQARGVRNTTGASITFLLNGGEDFPQKELLKALISSKSLYELVQGDVFGYENSFLNVGTKKNRITVEIRGVFRHTGL
jgi:hypothetical protein